jgi:hypothetical protein
MLTTSTGCWAKEVEGWKDDLWDRINGDVNPIGWGNVETEINAGQNFLRHARIGWRQAVENGDPV